MNGSTPTNSTVWNNYVENADVGIGFGYDIHNNAMVNMQAGCISSFLGTFAANTTITENYCRSVVDGFVVSGPASGTPVQVKNNYVLAADQGMIQGAGYVSFVENIIDSATDWTLVDAAKVTRTDNLCDDTGCDDPVATTLPPAPFTLDMSVN